MQIKHATFAYGKDTILNGINLSFQKGAITTLMGANGCGKTTLLNLCMRNLKLNQGKIFLDKKDINQYSNKAYAQIIAMVYQQNQIIGDITVERYVAYGRTPYLNPLQRLTKDDYQHIDWAIDVTGLGDIKKRQVRHLSGGQKQRVYIAMALAQKSQWLFLDEPTTYLDIKYQIDILNLIQSINQTFNISIVMVLHDIMQAINYSDQVIGMYGGKVLFNGAPKDVLTDDGLSKLFDTKLIMAEHGDVKIVLPRKNIKYS